MAGSWKVESEARSVHIISRGALKTSFASTHFERTSRYRREGGRCAATGSFKMSRSERCLQRYMVAYQIENRESTHE